MAKEDAVKALLCELFSATELLALALEFPRGQEIAAALPGAFAPEDEIATLLVPALYRHGALDDRFFAKLIEWRPQDTPHIVRVEKRWNLERGAVFGHAHTWDLALSYLPADLELAKGLRQALVNHGYKAFLGHEAERWGRDPHPVLPGFYGVDCAQILLLATPAYLSSAWDLDAFRSARVRGLQVIVLATHLPPRLPEGTTCVQAPLDQLDPLWPVLRELLRR